MQLRRVEYSDLSNKQREIYNFQKAAAVLVDYGFNCIKLDDDWESADFLAYHKDGDQMIKVQLKGKGVSINKKYLDKDLYMCFELDSTRYLIPHDELISIADECTNWLNTKSWIDKGTYFARTPPRSLRHRLKFFALHA